MLFFPQLVEHPVTKSERVRTVYNELGDGRRVTYSDSDEHTIGWELPMAGLTGAEWQSIEMLFGAAEGRLQYFTFLDPTANLLSNSEDLQAPEWVKDPFLQLQTGVADPLGTTRATRVTNAGQAVQRIAQTLPVPAWFRYAFSMWRRNVGGSWTRQVFDLNPGGAGTQVTFAVDLAAGEQIDLFGLQAEAQPAASAYRKTSGPGGVYVKARFGSDRLVGRAEATNEFAGRVEIVCRP